MAASLKQVVEMQPPAWAARSIETVRRKRSELLRLVIEADRGSKQPEQLRAYISDNRELMVDIGYLASMVEADLISRLACKGKEGVIEAIEGEMSAIVGSVLPDNASALERLLAVRVGLCWLRLQVAEYHRSDLMRGNVSIKALEYADRALTRGQARFIRACEALARMRALVVKN